MIEDGFRTYVAAQTGILAYVGSDRKRIAALQAPMNYPRPFLVFTRTGTTPVHSMAGDTGITEVGISIDIVADTSKQLTLLADAVRLNLDGYSGLMGSDYVQFCLLSGYSADYVQIDGSDEGLYTGAMEYRMMYEHTAATP